MTTITFISLRGTTLQGKVQEIRKIKGLNVSFVKMLNRIYAICDNYSISESYEGEDKKVFEQSIINQL